jgi:hypothetical protein
LGSKEWVPICHWEYPRQLDVVIYFLGGAILFCIIMNEVFA